MFSLSDFACRCDRKDCDAVSISTELVEDFTKLRRVVGMPFIVTSGVRCKYWNDKIGSSDSSLHLLGEGVDFKVVGGAFRYMVVKLAPSFGFFGIGINKNFIHLDRRKTTTPIIFGY